MKKKVGMNLGNREGERKIYENIVVIKQNMLMDKKKQMNQNTQIEKLKLKVIRKQVNVQGKEETEKEKEMEKTISNNKKRCVEYYIYEKIRIVQ